MANMSYCRFENTFRDLLECYDFLSYNDIDELSESEKKYALKLIKLCSDISEDFLHEINKGEENETKTINP